MLRRLNTLCVLPSSSFFAIIDANNFAINFFAINFFAINFAIIESASAALYLGFIEFFWVSAIVWKMAIIIIIMICFQAHNKKTPCFVKFTNQF